MFLTSEKAAELGAHELEALRSRERDANRRRSHDRAEFAENRSVESFKLRSLGAHVPQHPCQAPDLSGAGRPPGMRIIIRIEQILRASLKLCQRMQQPPQKRKHEQ